jgi:Zn ribbon nucleic-acid-binding protein
MATGRVRWRRISMAEKQLDCPACSKQRHLYLNIEKGVFYCFCCGYSGRSRDLEAQGIHVPRKTSELLKPVSLSFRAGEAVSDPPEYYPITTCSVEYLTNRWVHDSILTYLRKKIYETSKGILFFFPDEDYWQVRKWEAWTPPRWVNPTVAPRTPAVGVVYHLRTHYDSDRVVLVEGLVDALRVAPFANVAAVLSTNLHEEQLFHLSYIYKRADLMLDGDVPVSKLLAQRGKVGGIFQHSRIIDYSADDPGTASDDELEEVLDECL